MGNSIISHLNYFSQKNIGLILENLKRNVSCQIKMLKSKMKKNSLN